MIYVSTGFFRDRTAYQTSLFFIKNKIKHIELSSGKYSDNFHSELNALKKKINLRIHNYTPPPKIPFVLNLCSDDRYILRKTINHIKNGIVLAKKTNSKYFSFHAGFRFDPKISQLGRKFKKVKLISKKVALKVFKSRVKLLNKFAKKNRITLLIENNVFSKKTKKAFKENPFLLTNSKDIISFFNGLDKNIRLLLDVGHLKVSSFTEGFNLKSEHNAVLPYIAAYHLSENNGKEDSNKLINKNSWFLSFLKKRLDYYSLEVDEKNIMEIKNQILLLKKYLK
jgi:sugar phosphate isomerase/epimerase